MAYIGAQVRNARLQALIEGKEEFCVVCLETMGFPKSLHVYARERFANDASYVEGAGQSCGECNRDIDAKAGAA